MISTITVPNSSIARQAQELARSASNDMLFNHVMRSFLFAELFAQQEGATVDHELLFVSATLHDLGLTEVAQGPHRFEIEGANTARKFLLDHGVENDRAWKVWDNIALHSFDINLFRDDTSRLMQLGIRYDVRSDADAQLDPKDIAAVVERYPRLSFKAGFYDLLRKELESKHPYEHVYHLCTCIAHSLAPVKVPDARGVINSAPFDE